MSAPPARIEAEGFGAGMLRRFGWTHALLGLGRTFRELELDGASAGRVKRAADEGAVVYVLLQRNGYDHLALNHVLTRRRLPLSVWAPGVSQFWWQPVVAAWKGLIRRTLARLRGEVDDPHRSGFVRRAVAERAPITLFLDERPLFGGDRPDPFEDVVQAQVDTPERPVRLLPVVVIWDRAPDTERNPVATFLGADRDRPGPLRRFVNLLFRGREAQVRIGDPVALEQLVDRVEPERRVRALRTLLRRFLKRESKIVRGPRLLPDRTLQQLVLDNPPMRRLAADYARERGLSLDRVQRKMEKEYRHIAARFRWWAIRLADLVLQPLWTRVYAGVDVPEEDIERIRQGLREGSIVLVPCHRSHFDYVLLSWVFYRHRIIVPHIVAGENLALPVLQIWLRGAGAFFVKRRFGDDPLHPAIFARYLRELLLQGYPVEFYIEGTRSRSGRLLPPKLGVLGMVLDAAAMRPAGREVTLLPLSIAYDRVAEEGAYTREQSGAEKRPESLGDVARATRVLGRRYGRVYLRVGEPLPLSEVVDAGAGDATWESRSPEARRATLQQVGETVVYRIGQCTVLLPTHVVAMALLAHPRRGVRQADLLDRARRLRNLCRRKGAPLSAHLDRFDEAVRLTLADFSEAGLVQSIGDGDDRIWAIDPSGRIPLDLYKNANIHRLVPAGFIAAALRPHADEPVPVDALDAPLADLIALLAREVVWNPAATLADRRDEGLADLVAHGAVAVEEGRVRVTDTERIAELYDLMRASLEAADLVLRTAPRLARVPIDGTTLARALREAGDEALAAGQLARPEALGKASLDNAIRTLTDLGGLQRTERGTLAVPEIVAVWRDKLAPMVDG